MPEVFANNATGNLNADITSGALSLVLQAGQGSAFPATGNFRILIGTELILVGARSGDTLSTLTRGIEGTAAAAHTAGNLVTHLVTAGALGTFVQVTSFAQLFDSILGAPAANFDITSIDQKYSHLRLLVYARTDEATTNSLVTVRFNNDSAANYDYQLMYGQGATAAAVESFGQTSVRIGGAAGNTAGANLFASNIAEILHYAGSANNKTIDSTCALKTGVATGNLFRLGLAGFWRSNAAITRITVLPGAAANFATGSRCTLYGFL